MGVPRPAVKVLITLLMIGTLYTADDTLSIFGLGVCSLLGNDARLLGVSTDLLLFTVTLMVSKHLALRDYPEEGLLFDAHILCLTAIYLYLGDRLRVSLLGAWLPFYYTNNNVRFWGYTTLVTIVPLYRLLCCAYLSLWLPGTAMLYRGIYTAGKKLRIGRIR
ncbi:hypothetical protein F4861DRAFT_509352 [Xylaria intraflava]|nr:hypothetical protein F4861DRAFT_509352 [Xylaria intraflava]